MPEEKDQQNNITLFAKTNFRNKQASFGIKRDDRRKHMYIVGKTGMGKSTMMENMVIQDIVNGEGLALVDPHGDLVQKVIDYVPNHRVNDVIYFNPQDTDFPVSFNILEAVDTRYKHLVASGLMGVFTKIWANLWSARMEYILNNCILALLDSPGNTLLGISRMLMDKKYRKKIVDNVKDPMVRSFWIDEFANWPDKYRQEAIAPIQNKVGQFLSSGIIRNIVGQTKSTLDLREVMDSRKILLMNLSKGSVGEDNSALLGAMLITKLQLAALSRVDVPEEERKDFYLYVDEFQNFATESFATILSEARKYRLNLIVGHQYIGQLVQDKNTKVRDAVFGNVGTIVTFRIGAADAEFMEKEFAPLFTENDLVNLPKHNVLLKLMINGVASDPFTAETLPPMTINAPTGNTEKIMRISRERYANPVKEVEEKILRWMGQDFHDGIAVVASGAGEKDEELSPSTVEAQLLARTAEDLKEAEATHERSAIAERKEAEYQRAAVEMPQPVEEPEAPVQYVRPEPQPKPEPKQEHRQEQRPQQRQEHRGEHKNHDGKKHNKPQQQQKKDKNPIWDTVANLTNEKIEKKRVGIGHLVEKIETGLQDIKVETPKYEPEPQPPTPVDEFEEQVESFVETLQTPPSGQVVLQPNQPTKIEEI
jgi:hypothetical protein